MTEPRTTFPDNAKTVYRGQIFDVVQWEQTMFDGSTQIFEGLRRPDTVEVVALADSKILIEEQLQPDLAEPFLSPPGGRVDPGETPEEAVKRELLEETGYVSDDWELWFSVRPFGKLEWTVYIFIARGCRKAQEARTDAGERITTREVSFEEFLMLSDEPRFRGRELVEELLRVRLDPAKKEALRSRLGISA